MPRLFNENHNETYVSDALDLERELVAVVKPLIQRYLDKGYPYRDIEMVCVESITLLILEMRAKASIRAQIKDRPI